MLGYFASEVGIHCVSQQAIDRSALTEYDKRAVSSALHQTMELIVVTGILYLYRARPRGEYFTLMLQHDNAAAPHIIPFYVAMKTVEADALLNPDSGLRRQSRLTERRTGKYVVILKPRDEESARMSNFVLGISTKAEGISQPSASGEASQQLLAGSVELQSY
jgi:hypothetical protein